MLLEHLYGFYVIYSCIIAHPNTRFCRRFLCTNDHTRFHISVGLAQACPNYLLSASYICILFMCHATVLMIMASHQTFFKHLTSQTKLGQSNSLYTTVTGQCLLCSRGDENIGSLHAGIWDQLLFQFFTN